MRGRKGAVALSTAVPESPQRDAACRRSGSCLLEQWPRSRSRGSPCAALMQLNGKSRFRRPGISFSWLPPSKPREAWRPPVSAGRPGPWGRWRPSVPAVLPSGLFTRNPCSKIYGKENAQSLVPSTRYAARLHPVRTGPSPEVRRQPGRSKL